MKIQRIPPIFTGVALIATLILFFTLVVPGYVESNNAPIAAYSEKFFDCRPGISWCYAFSTIEDSDGWYKTWFFAPANRTYMDKALECIYMARSTTLDSDNWQVYTGGGYENYPYASDGSGAPANWMPVVCHNNRYEGHFEPGDVGSNNVIPGYNSMDLDKSYSSQSKTITYKLIQDTDIAHPSYGGTAFFAPAGTKIYRVTFDFVTNYDNQKVIAAVTVPGSAKYWTYDHYGNNAGSVDLSIDDKDWVAFGMFSKSSFHVNWTNWLFQVKNLKIYFKGGGYATGDPSVIKVAGKYYMLYSMWDRVDPGGYVYGATSTDGINWIGTSYLWIGHRPSMIVDGDEVKAWYDIPRGETGRTIRMRSIPTSQLASFLDESAWSSPATPTVPLNSANTEILKTGNSYFAVTDGLDQDNSLVVNYSFSENGLDFDAPEKLVGQESIPEEYRDGIVGITVPQLFRDGDAYYLIASSMTPSRQLNQAFLFRVEFDPIYFEPEDVGSNNTIPGYNSMDLDKSYSSQSKTITYKLIQGTDIAHPSYGGTAFFAPAGTKIYRVTFDFVTNYDNQKVIAAVTVPGSAKYWTYDYYGNNAGSVDLSIDDKDWVAFGMFSKSSFHVNWTNWLFQVKNLRVYYH